MAVRPAQRVGFKYASATFDSNYETMLFSMQSSLEANGGKWWGKQDEYMQDFMQAVQDAIIDNMLAGPAPELAEATVLKKSSQGYPFPSRSWYESGYLIENVFDRGDIEIDTSGPRKRMELQFSDKAHVRYGEEESLSLASLVEIIEFGRQGPPGAPPRPVVGPVIDALVDGTSPLYDNFSRNILRSMTLFCLGEEE